jgi:hypothetical protein
MLVHVKPLNFFSTLKPTSSEAESADVRIDKLRKDLQCGYAASSSPGNFEI